MPIAICNTWGGREAYELQSTVVRGLWSKKGVDLKRAYCKFTHAEFGMTPSLGDFQRGRRSLIDQSVM